MKLLIIPLIIHIVCFVGCLLLVILNCIAFFQGTGNGFNFISLLIALATMVWAAINAMWIVRKQ